MCGITRAINISKECRASGARHWVYGNQEIIDTTAEQMSKLTFSHMFGGKTHQVAIDLADTLADMIPMQDAVLSFGNSGSDANDTHIKLLRYYHEAS